MRISDWSSACALPIFYSEIVPFSAAEAALERMKPKGVILSGSPASVPASGSPRAPQSIFDSGLPILGICYGQQVMTQQLGGQVEPGGADGERDGEFGRAFLKIGSASGRERGSKYV